MLNLFEITIQGLQYRYIWNIFFSYTTFFTGLICQYRKYRQYIGYMSHIFYTHLLPCGCKRNLHSHSHVNSVIFIEYFSVHLFRDFPWLDKFIVPKLSYGDFPEDSGVHQMRGGALSLLPDLRWGGQGGKEGVKVIR